MPDEDIARLLPEPPPPRTARRDAAIGAAMRRFDGVEAGPAAPLAPTAWRRPAWPRLSRPQIGAFASIALVAAVGLPIALIALKERVPASAPQPPPVSVAANRAARGAAAPADLRSRPIAAPSSPTDVKPHGAEPAAEAVMPPPPVADDARDIAARAPAPSAAEAPQFVPPAPEPEPLAVTGSRAAAPAAMATKQIASEAPDSADIIITASRINNRPAAAYRRGDWNACTVNDPGHSLDGCKRLVDPTGKGPAGQAAAHVADGLSLAWQGDLDGAIAAFDAAIALQPRLAFAWLNRGLAYQRQGDTGHALADLNRSVRYAPYAARGYYNRSLILEQTGDTRRARADADRAVSIDPRYRAALE